MQGIATLSFPATLSQMSVSQISNSVSYVYDTVIKETHFTKPLASQTGIWFCNLFVKLWIFYI